MIGDKHSERVVQRVQRQQAAVVGLVHQLVRRHPRRRQPRGGEVSAQELLEPHAPPRPVEELVHIAAERSMYVTMYVCDTEERH